MTMTHFAKITLLTAALMFSVAIVFGQGAAPAGSEGTAVAAPAAVTATTENQAVVEEQKMTLWQLWNVGGWCMYPLGLLNVAAVAFTIYGFLMVRENKMLVPHLIPTIQESLDGLRLDEAVGTCNGTPSMLTNTLHAGLQRISDGILDVTSLEKAMEEASVEENQAGLRMIGYISICAQIAPMTGLLGTVSGMIKAFEKIGRGAMGKPELLANDIGEALVTTAYGLIIGIPAMLFYFYLKSRYTANITKMSRVLGNLSHHLVTASRRAQEGDGEEAAAAPGPAAGV